MNVKRVSNIKIQPLSKQAKIKNFGIPYPLPDISVRNFIMGVLGPTGSSKTTLYANLIRKHYFEIFNKIYFCSPNVTDEGKVYDKSLDSIEFSEERVFQTINNEIADYIKEDIENDEDFENDDFRALLIIDDLANELKSVKHTNLTKLILKSRHLHLSIIMISHKFTYFQRIHRTNFTHFIMYRSKSKNEIKSIYEDIIDLPEEKFNNFYEYATKDKYNFLYVICNSNPQMYYKNFEEELT
jgi:hypothetical protein